MFNNNNLKPKIFITAPLDFLQDLREIISEDMEVIYKFGASYNEIRDTLISNNFDAWLCSPCPEYEIGEKLLDLCPSIKIISTPSTGTNHLDLDYLESKKISYFSLRGSTTVNKIYASSEFTFELLMSVIRKTPYAFESVKAGNWREVEGLFRGRELAGLTVGIIGYGRIGSNLSRYCKAFRMKIIAYDPYVSINEPEVIQIENLDNLLTTADVIAVCVHLNDETFHMVNVDMFNLMKDGVYFINTSRGDIIEESALISALESGKILSAGLDVISDEFLGDKNKHPLIQYAKSHDNLIITPHIAGLTYDSERKAQTAAYEAVYKHFTGEFL